MGHEANTRCLSHRWQGDPDMRLESSSLPFQIFGRTITSAKVESRYLLAEPIALEEVMRKNQHDLVCWMLLLLF